MSGETTVSVIMPAYNAAKTIAASIESVLAQTYTNWELIIVNDGSTDDTVRVIAPYLRDSRVKLINLERNQGLPAARNLGAERASGDYIAFLDADDLWLPAKLEKQLKYHQSHPEYFISHTDFEAFTSRGTIRRPWRKILVPTGRKKGRMLPVLYYQNVIGVLTALVKKRVFEEVKGFDARLWTGEDQDLWIRIAERGYEFGYIDEVLARYRVSATGLSRATGKYKRALKRVIEKHVDLNPKVSAAVRKKAWGIYYRHFGTVYHKRGEYRLASKYFWAALSRLGISFMGATTLAYILFNFLKKILKRNSRKVVQARR